MATMISKLLASLRTPQQLLIAFGSIGSLVILLRRYKAAKTLKLIVDHSVVADQEFDIVVVGGGTAGCALAARLSEDPRIRVLLLEAGGSGKALLFTRIPSAFGQLFHTKHVFPFYTQPQVHAKGQSRFWPRAKMLGGCSSINAQMAQYGAPEDFDEWAEVSGDSSWSWKEFAKYFRKMETLVPHPDYPSPNGTFRGQTGPVQVGYHNYVTKIALSFVKACIAVGIPHTIDFNGPNGTMGVNRIMTYIDKNHARVSSETAYLTPNVLARDNLSVVVHAQVTRILFANTDGRVRATGVEFATSEGGPRCRVHARKDVILSAGAIHTPHLLMLSGVGPANHLNKHGIPVVVDLPGVGSNLVDHPVIDTYFKEKTSESLYYLGSKDSMSQIKALGALLWYKTFGGGPVATNIGESAAFVRSDDPILFPKSEFSNDVKDSTPGPNSPDLELFSTPMAYKEHGSFVFPLPTYALHVYLLRPTSRGEVLLRSNNPFDLPSVNPNYLQNPEDTEKLFRGLKLCLRLSQTEPLASHFIREDKDADFDHQRHMASDEELRELVKERVETVYHPTSTCRMAPRDLNGVVDSKLRVYGVDGLRVCDASFFPYIVSGHTAGAVFASAEKLADLIKAEWD